jgi:hypothetical protein
MSLATELPISTTAILSDELESLIEDSINSMSPKDLRLWSKDSDKIMTDSKNRMGARPAVRGTDR